MLELRRNSARVALVCVAVVMAGACGRDEAGTGDTGIAMTDTGAAVGGAAGDTGMAPATGTLSDANIVYILDQKNALDSATGAVAVTKGTNSEVREFGRMMVRDHHMLRQQGQDLAKRLNVTPAAPANDNSQAELQRTTTMLNNAAKGRDFDKAYIDDQVTYHTDLLATATSAMAAAQNAELKNFIQKAAPSVQAHLDRAQAIQKRLQ